MTRLGYTKREARHLYLGEFLDKFDTYKRIFNIEKFGGYNTETQEIRRSLHDF